LEDFPELEQAVCGRRCDLVNDVPGGLNSLEARRAFTLHNKPKEDQFTGFVLRLVLDNVERELRRCRLTVEKLQINGCKVAADPFYKLRFDSNQDDLHKRLVLEKITLRTVNFIPAQSRLQASLSGLSLRCMAQATEPRDAQLLQTCGELLESLHVVKVWEKSPAKPK
jgi:hypothetical protein